jgi:hypothetical protein
MDEDRENALMRRLMNIQKQVQWIADEEARSAWFKGVAALTASARAYLTLIADPRTAEVYINKKCDKGRYSRAAAKAFGRTTK